MQTVHRSPIVSLNLSVCFFKSKAEKAADVKAKLILEKLDEDEAKAEAQQEMLACVKKQEESQKEFTQSMNTVTVQLCHLCNTYRESFRGLHILT